MHLPGLDEPLAVSPRYAHVPDIHGYVYQSMHDGDEIADNV